MESKYPDAAEIPQVKMDTMQKPQGANPVVDAFETIMKYIKGLEDKQDPKAAPMKEHLTAMIQSVVAGGGKDGAEPVENPTMAGKPAMPAKPEMSDEEPEMPDAESESAGAPIGGAPAPKMGFNPFKAPEDDEMADDQMKQEQMRKMKRKNLNTSIQPLA